jgi:alkanesulfonate monooxygenase SsuD/methylene tetrahydromethanopterin reductase-like flavin-dependent oxidoreductase (luciferase family)
MVHPIGFRNPALLAQIDCNLHAVSKGRFLLGVGAGWYKTEYMAKGIPFPKLQVRHEQLIEALKIMRPLIEGKRVDYQGQHYWAHTVGFPYPKGKMPIILGGWSAFVKRAVEEFGDEWNLFNGTPEDFKEIKEQVDKMGRKIAISRAGPFIIAKTKAHLQRSLKSKSGLLKEWGLPTTQDELLKRGVPCGDVDEFRAYVSDLKKSGVDRVYFDIFFPDDKGMVELLTRTLKSSKA